MKKDTWRDIKFYIRGITVYASVFAFAVSMLNAIITPVDSLAWLLTNTVLPTSTFVMLMVTVIALPHVYPELFKKTRVDKKGFMRVLPDFTVIGQEIYDMGVFSKWYDSL